jgi:WD40 repeat protein
VSGGYDNKLRIWDVESRNNERVLEGHTSVVNAVSYSPDGEFIASASTFDNTLRFWDASTGKPYGEPLPINKVTKIAFSPDGKMLAAATYDGVQVWDVPARKPFTVFLSRRETQVHAASNTDVAFGPDGHTLATTSDGMTIQLWNLDPKRWLERDCRVANRNLSPAEWDFYIGHDTRYRHTCQ